MVVQFPKEREAKREMLLSAVERIGNVLQASGAISEERATLAPEAVQSLRDAGMFRLKLPAVVGGAEADPVTEMLVLEALAYHDFTSAWCTMVGATAVASLGAFLPQAGLDQVFSNGHIPTASISFFPAGRAVREKGGYRLNGRWRFNSGIHHSEWVLGGTIVEGTEKENGRRPLVIFSTIGAMSSASGELEAAISRSRITTCRNTSRSCGICFIQSRVAGVLLICCRRSATSPRNTAAWRSEQPDEHWTN
jgi:indole-3-acetate monooxygenase